jgi:hypothetical protein
MSPRRGSTPRQTDSLERVKRRSRRRSTKYEGQFRAETIRAKKTPDRRVKSEVSVL